MRFQPNPHLDIRIDMKAPGLDEGVETVALTHPYPEGAVDGYEKLLYDVINCDQSHFVHADEVLESWRIVDDYYVWVIFCKIRTAPYIYMQGSWGPTHKTNFFSFTNWDYPA